jgi:hypothetical protein
MSRTRSRRNGRNEGREVAGPRPGWDMLPPRSGGSLCANSGVDHAHVATTASPQSKSRSSFRTRCMMTASLRATATLARRMPIRAARPSPHVLSFDGFGWRKSKTSVTTFRDATGLIDLAGLIASWRETKISADRRRLLEPVGIVDHRRLGEAAYHCIRLEGPQNSCLISYVE